MNDNRDRTYLQTPEQWTQFLSAFLHEVRTPLASVRMLADLLTEAPPGRLADAERRYTENLREVTQDLQTLVGEVAELTRLLAGRVILRADEVSLEQLVDQVEEAVRPRAWDSGIALTDFLAPSLPRLFRTDAERLRQALILLLGAAVSQAKTEVVLRLGTDGRDLRIVISSDGPPFAEAALGTLFTPFQDGVRPGRTRGGRSLALPLASEVVRALAGSLSAANHEGRPVFELRLPPTAP
jgi:two-component system, NarL family, sensor histidine kinase BarA